MTFRELFEQVMQAGERFELVKQKLVRDREKVSGPHAAGFEARVSGGRRDVMAPVDAMLDREERTLRQAEEEFAPLADAAYEAVELVLRGLGFKWADTLTYRFVYREEWLQVAEDVGCASRTTVWQYACAAFDWLDSCCVIDQDKDGRPHVRMLDAAAVTADGD